MKVASYNGCKVYNLSSGKTMPQWMSQSKRKALQKDEEFRRRVELIQDFEMPTASQCIAMTKDCEHIILTGTYPPVVKCFTTNDLAMKFQRGLTCDVVAVETLSEDFGKLVFLQSDRTLSFHAPYGTHHSVRVPKFGRHMMYNWDNCDLYVAGNGNEVYRMNLDAGQFREPYKASFEGMNKMHINPVHQLLGLGGEGGVCEFWDPRAKKAVARLNIANPLGGNMDITELKFDSDGLTLGVGTSNGLVYLYDIRSRSPLYSKEHQYNLPIVDITFHHSSRSVISTDKKVIKIWSRAEADLGKVMTNIETSADINSIVFARDKRGETGLIMAAGEQSRVMTYFVPQLGPAPRWCSFLEGLTEELEEAAGQVYEDFKFLTRGEIDELGATGLLGTPMLRPYMHGFFIEMKLYNKLRAVSKPFEYDEYRKQKIREKIEEKRGSRIAPLKRLPKVNKELAEKILKKTPNESEGKLIDERFQALFEREEFQQDRESADYLVHHPNAKRGGKKNAQGGDSDDELDIYDEVEEQGAEFSEEEEEDEDGGEEDEEEAEEDQEGESEDEDEEKLSRKQKKKQLQKNTKDDGYEVGAIERASLKKREKMQERESRGGKKMFQLAEGFSAADAVFGDQKSMKEVRKQSRALAALPLKERLQQNSFQKKGRDGSGKKAFKSQPGNRNFKKGGFKSKYK